MKNHIPLTSRACEEKKPECYRMKVSFRAISETWATPPNISWFLNGKVRFWSVNVFFIKKNWVKKKGTILFTNHIDLGWKENSLTKIDWDPMELSRKTVMISTKPRPPPPPRGLLGLIFPGYVPLASQGPYPIIVYFVANCRPHISHFWANMSLLRSQLSHFLFMYLPYQSFK